MSMTKCGIIKIKHTQNKTTIEITKVVATSKVAMVVSVVGVSLLMGIVLLIEFAPKVMGLFLVGQILLAGMFLGSLFFKKEDEVE